MRKRLKKLALILGILVGVLVLIVFGLVTFVCYGQAQALVHPEPVPLYDVPENYGLDYEKVSLTTEDGYKLKAWYVPSTNQAAIILQHGYPNNRAAMLPIAAVFARHGYGLIMVDLRAQGMSEGDTVSFGLREVRDVEAAYQYLLTRPEIDPERIGALGDSMGGAVVILYAAQNPSIKAAVSVSAYASLQDVVRSGVETFTGLPAFPFAFIIQWFAEKEGDFNVEDIAPIEHIGSISPRPVFILHGGTDDLIPPDNGQRLYEAAGEPRELWFEPDFEHGQGSFVIDRAEEYERRVVGFFDQYLLGE
jgi:fermentation-respiration switch protein FrsA (DUF1100 family)